MSAQGHNTVLKSIQRRLTIACVCTYNYFQTIVNALVDAQTRLILRLPHMSYVLKYNMLAHFILIMSCLVLILRLL